MTRILLTSGEYSEYGVHGLYEIPSKEWLVERLREWAATHPDQTAEYHFMTHDFVEWITGLPECAEAEYEEAHVGSYGSMPDEVFGIGLMDPKAKP